ncbi:hypothetical protein IAQ61_000759 [Plenodomus lingam]|uniref:uncharacterized protein n=1 Tax=Leptosphaeria maculans TaxID=5022 RepID=UPI003333C05A|nr:hypothetical protein IAQ61_000759 [Plenodomus lingam]
MSEPTIKREESTEDSDMRLRTISPSAPSTISLLAPSLDSNDSELQGMRTEGVPTQANFAPNSYSDDSICMYKMENSEQEILYGMFRDDFEPHDAQGLHLPFVASTTNVQDGSDDPVLLPQTDTDELALRVDSLRNATAYNGQQVAEHDGIIAEVLVFNQNIESVVQHLTQRLATVEYENARLKSMLGNQGAHTYNELKTAVIQQPKSWRRNDNAKRPRSPSQGPCDYGDCGDEEADGRALYEEHSRGRRMKIRKQLQIAIPDDLAPPMTGTPLSKATNNPSNVQLPTLPQTPLTPGRIGPGNLTKRSSTSLHKRKMHSLDKMLPPSLVEIPHMPLTDTEVIVYFFQSISRPTVALRLYAREWGPRNIVDALHAHRTIEPPYLRNTCSVKCTTAIKLGRAKFGEDWEDNLTTAYKQADDVLATDLMRLDANESPQALNYYVRNLCTGMIKHPKVGVDGGIFSRCVQYCQETQAPYTLSNVWMLAHDLQSGRTPTHPSPNPDMDSFIQEQYPFIGQNEGDQELKYEPSEAPKTPRTPKMSKTVKEPKTPVTPKTPKTPKGKLAVAKYSHYSSSELAASRSTTPGSVFSANTGNTDDT